MPSSAPFGVLAVAVASILFAVNGTVAKLAMQAGLSPTRLVELRSVGAAVILVTVALVVLRGRMRLRRHEIAAMAVLGVIGMAFVQWLYLVAISRLPVGLALLVEYTAPLLVALFARFVLGEQVRARVWWALGACLVGLALVAQVRAGVELDVIGLAAAGGAAIALATYYLLGERLVARRDPLSTQAWSLAFAGLFWLALQPLWTFDAAILADDVALPGALAGVTLPLWALVAYVIVLGTVVPYTLVLIGLKIVGAARAGLIGMIEPVAASVAAWLVLGEAMTAVQLVGAAVVLAGVGMAETARRTPESAVLPDTIAV
ncbi:DMT family transporter [Cellulomonas fimi]|uniref:DMT family transporter n=1 Tax=Cellulomonas fimi TaxID=1708 RepID=A0A7Y0QHL9_CELFI|nr:DMT family transporter [Cellulomonas fimi]NMR20024.1 DMT family transporter [Cellulomonas fimi]